MKTNKITLLILMVVIGTTLYPIKLKSQNNTYAVAFDPNLSGAVTSTAYNVSEIDIYLNNSGWASLISAFTYEDNNNSYLHIRKSDPCLGKYENFYNVALYYPDNYYPHKLKVHDILETKIPNNNIVFCGGFMQKVGYVGMLDNMMNPIGSNLLLGFEPFVELFSIVEVPSMGYVACGKTHKGGGILALNYNLSPIAGYEVPYILTHVIFDVNYQWVQTAGYNANVLCAYTIDPMQLFSGNPNFVIGQFEYSEPNYNIYWNQSGNDAVRILTTNGGKVILAASGYSNNFGGNYAILHENSINGNSPGLNYIYNQSNGDTYFKEIEKDNFGDKLDLLLLDANTNQPVVMHIDPYNTNWGGMRINTGVDPNIKMFKRYDCDILEICAYQPGGNANSLYYYQSYSDVNNVNYIPGMETPENFQVQANMPNMGWAQNFVPVNVHHSHHINMLNPVNSHTNPIIHHWGDCYNFDYCVKSTASTQETTGVEENINSSVMLYNDYIELSDMLEYSNYKIVDIMGREVSVAKVEKSNISTKTLIPGTYILQLQKTNGGIEYHKFMKQ